jgi:ribosomal 50S subunit-recycling heat shock protein
MRLDKFLQAVGIVKQRTRAKALCERGSVRVDGQVAKAARPVRAGHKVQVRLGEKLLTYNVLNVPERVVPRAARGEYVELIGTQSLDVAPDLGSDLT